MKITRTTPWQPFRESLVATLARTVTIALVLGVLLARPVAGDQSRWPAVAMLMLWPSFGGHWIDVWFLNWLRPRLSATRGVQAAARVGTWFVGGILLSLCMALTTMTVAGFQGLRSPKWWVGGFAFIGIELVAHLSMVLLRAPNFYDGRG